MSAALTKLGKARQLLAECQTIDEAKNIRDQAEAFRAYAKQQSEGLDAQNFAAEIKLRAERKCGDLLSRMGLRAGRKGNGSTMEPLSELGITKKQSHRWQTEAAVPDDAFDEFIRSTHEGGRELTSIALYKLGKQTIAVAPIEQDEDTTVEDADADCRVVSTLDELAGDKFGCIYADPPWKYGNQATRASTDNHYGTMSIDQLCALPVAEIAADDSHLHLWTTNGFLPDAFKVLAAWGFEYRSCFVWVKPQMGIGNYWRVSHEFLLLGIRGNAKRFTNRSLMSWAKFERGKHSTKPEEIRGFVESASPGPYLEIFGRRKTPGWTVLGNQVEDRLFD